MVAFVFGLTYCATLNELTPNYWSGGRAVECTGLENRQASGPRGFESHPLRHWFRGGAPLKLPRVALARIRNKPIALQWAYFVSVASLAAGVVIDFAWAKSGRMAFGHCTRPPSPLGRSALTLASGLVAGARF